MADVTVLFIVCPLKPLNSVAEQIYCLDSEHLNLPQNLFSALNIVHSE